MQSPFCIYDPFGYDYMMYSVHNKCDEVPELEYEDGLRFLYFNTKGTKGGTSAMKALLNYLQYSRIENVTDDITRTIHDCVCKVKTLPEVRDGYMTLEEKIFYERLDAKEEGREEGIEEGREAGIKEGREEDFCAIVTKLRERFTNEEIAEFLHEPLARIQAVEASK